MKMISATLLASALIVGLTVSAAQAAGPDFCHDYAIAALRQVHAAMDVPACHPFAPPRWSTDYHVHYDWCRGADRDAAWAERDARAHHLRDCRGY
jgi:hypothetical protein